MDEQREWRVIRAGSSTVAQGWWCPACRYVYAGVHDRCPLSDTHKDKRMTRVARAARQAEGDGAKERAMCPATEREALRLAEQDCRGTYTIAHIQALRRLARQGLVRQVTTQRSAYYTITEAGRTRLQEEETA